MVIHTEKILLSEFLKFISSSYHEEDNNCYDFVIGMLSRIQTRDLNKQRFLEEYVLPSTRRLATYLVLLRGVEENGGCFIQ